MTFHLKTNSIPIGFRFPFHAIPFHLTKQIHFRFRGTASGFRGTASARRSGGIRSRPSKTPRTFWWLAVGIRPSPSTRRHRRTVGRGRAGPRTDQTKSWCGWGQRVGSGELHVDSGLREQNTATLLIGFNCYFFTRIKSLHGCEGEGFLRAKRG